MQDPITTFYRAFSNLDAEGMCACYHHDILFYDHAFGHLKGARACAMWTMLVESQRDKDFTITYRDITSSDLVGTAHWEAHYTFSKTGRRVHNVIEADMVIKDGLIIEHTDHFDLHRWAGQALGLTGKLLGGTSFFRKKLQGETKKALDHWITKHA